MQYNISNQQHHPSSKEGGYILLVVAIFLTVLTAGSAKWLNRVVEDTQVSGSLRDSSESLMLAETALDLIRGRFISSLDTVIENPSNVVDKVGAEQLASNKGAPNNFLFPYMYYVSAGAGMDQTQPSVLQKVANGEAVAAASGPLITREISSATTQLRINSLFASVGGNAFAPFLLTMGNNGLLNFSGASDWNAETSEEKVAVWIEVIENPTDSGAVDLYVQAVAQAGKAKSYIQRYLGTYNNALGTVALLAEASNINRANN